MEEAKEEGGEPMNRLRKWWRLIRMDSRWKTTTDFTEEAELTIKAAIGITILNGLFTLCNMWLRLSK